MDTLQEKMHSPKFKFTIGPRNRNSVGAMVLSRNGANTLIWPRHKFHGHEIGVRNKMKMREIQQ